MILLKFNVSYKLFSYVILINAAITEDYKPILGKCLYNIKDINW